MTENSCQNFTFKTVKIGIKICGQENELKTNKCRLICTSYKFKKTIRKKINKIVSLVKKNSYITSKSDVTSIFTAELENKII